MVPYLVGGIVGFILLLFIGTAAIVGLAIWVVLRRKRILRESGTPAQARVVLVGGSPGSGYVITLEVLVQDQPPVMTRLEARMPLEMLKRVTPGAIVPVRHAPNNPREVVLDLPDVR
jgi:hypothetical protein